MTLITFKKIFDFKVFEKRVTTQLERRRGDPAEGGTGLGGGESPRSSRPMPDRRGVDREPHTPKTAPTPL